MKAKRCKWLVPAGGATFATLLLWVGSIVLRTAEPVIPGQIVIRLVHTQLQTGVREAFDEVFRSYTKLHPNVRVEQLSVPERFYPMWLWTKVTDTLTPDLIQLPDPDAGDVNGDERALRYFVPLRAYVELPNPYNSGNSLSAVRWRDTFLDGINTAPSYSPNLLNYYGIPTTMVTTRLFYNRILWRNITGGDVPPTSLDELLVTCQQVLEYSRLTGRNLSPIAASRERQNAEYLLGTMFGSQTQQLSLRIEPTRRLETLKEDMAAAYLEGRWSLDSPDVVKGLQLVRELGQYLQPGFLQLQREDALFLFTQGRALMMVASSSDAQSISSQSPFPVGAFPLPMPPASDSTLGPISEADRGSQVAFAIAKSSPNFDTALDFLRFLTAQNTARDFSRRSGRLSAVLGVEPPPNLILFRPRLDGFPAGFSLTFGSQTQRLFVTNLHQLLSPEGGVKAMSAALLETGFDEALKGDIRFSVTSILKKVVIYDTVYWMLDSLNSIRPNHHNLERLSEIAESQTFQEEASYRRQFYVLQQDAHPPNAGH